MKVDGAHDLNQDRSASPASSLLGLGQFIECFSLLVLKSPAQFSTSSLMVDLNQSVQCCSEADFS